MQITFLGTGTSQGIPVIACDCAICKSTDNRDKRLRTSVMVEVNGKNLVIDTGPDFRQQMLREDVQQLDAVLFTHEHMDHLAGLDDVRAFNFKQRRDMDLYCDERVYKRLLEQFPYAFDEFKYPGVPELKTHIIDGTAFELDAIKIQPIEVLHYKLPVLGFRIGDFSYITDANYISEEEQTKIKGSKILVINALRQEKHISHFTLEEALEMIERLEVEQAYLIHLSHQMGFHKEIEASLPKNVKIAYDGLKLNL